MSGERVLVENEIRWQIGIMQPGAPGAIGAVTLAIGQNQVKTDVLLDPVTAREIGEALIAAAGQVDQPVSSLLVPSGPTLMVPDDMRGRG